MSDLSAAAAPDAPYVPPSAGAALRAHREAAGLTLDEVAQQLKLAPRQVQALEDDDYAKLPGRTFVRGFVRNYARFLQLDSDDVLALLPGSDVAPALERPTITPSGRPMGELPAEANVRRSPARWTIPLLLVAIVVAAGVYEFRRQQAESHRASAAPSVPAATAPAAAATGASGSALPNPVTVLSDTPTTAAASSSPTTPSQPATQAAAAPATTPPAADANAAAPASAPAAATDAQLVVTFTGTSWLLVRDRNGNTLVAENGQPGSTQTISGPLPLDVVIGNVRAVTATFRGQSIDLSPYVRGDVARLSLK